MIVVNIVPEGDSENTWPPEISFKINDDDNDCIEMCLSGPIRKIDIKKDDLKKLVRLFEIT